MWGREGAGIRGGAGGERRDLGSIDAYMLLSWNNPPLTP